MSMSITIQNLEARIKQYEEEIAKIVNTHGTLMGGLNELKQLLLVADEAAPTIDAQMVPVVDAVSEIVDCIEAVVVDDVEAVATPATSDTLA